MTIDFHEFSIVVQHNILRNMDMNSFLKTAITSKEMMEVAKSCDDKYWDVELRTTRRNNGFEMYSERSSGAKIKDMETLKLIFDNSTVRELMIYSHFEMPADINVRCQKLHLYHGTTCLATLNYSKRHKPARKYECVWIDNMPTDQDSLEWLSESCDYVWIWNGASSWSEYMPLKTPRIWLRASKESGGAVDVYAHALVEEWLRDQREIREILATSRAPLAGGVHDQFFRQYPNHFSTKRRNTYYRIRRNDDGAVLIVALREGRTSWAQISIPEMFQLGDNVEDRATKSFIFQRD